MSNANALKSGSLQNRQGIGFVLKLVIVYVAWKLLYLCLSNPHFAIHNAWLQVVQQICCFYAAIAGAVLNLMGDVTNVKGAVVFFTNSHQYFSVAEHCLAIPAMVIFASAILLFSGPAKDKLWFMPMGLFLIFLINLTRIIFLGYTIQHFSSGVFKFSHAYLYVVITYGFIFALIIWWMRRSTSLANCFVA